MNLERSAHPSKAQIDALLEYLEGNPSLAKGFPKSPSAKDAARKHWEKLTIHLNCMGGSEKSCKKWTKYWADKKSAVKKKASLRLAGRMRPNGVEEVVELSEVEERIVSLMGGASFANPGIDPLSIPQQSWEEKPTLPLNLGEPTTQLAMNTMADPYCSPESSYPSPRQSNISDESGQSVPGYASPPRTPPIAAEQPDQTTPSRQGVHPILASCTPWHPQHQLSREQRPLRTTSSRRRRRGSLTPAARYLRVEEKRLQLDRRNSDFLEDVTVMVEMQMERDSKNTSAIAQGLNSIGEGLKMLAEVNRNLISYLHQRNCF